MSIASTLKTGARATLVTVSLAAAMLVAVPAANAAPPNMNFSLQFGNGFNGNGYGYGGNGVQLRFGNGPSRWCLSDRQIGFQLQQQGWRNVKIVKRFGQDRLIAVAMKRGAWYEMRVDRCTGNVDRVRPVAQRNGNFSLTLGF
jgi:hypothetical protein